jgi:B12-binding domain/radical SAM domain protein
MYPLGFISIAEYLERAGYRVRIINLAVRMLNDPRFDAEKLIKKTKAWLFGIDLHWLPHAHGAIEVARLVKKHHPTSALVMGGLSASYYSRELFQYPEIDYVLRGDSTEEPLRQLMDCLSNGGDLSAVPNLTWRDAKGKIHENALSYVPDNLDDVMVNYYNHTLRSVVRHRDLANYIPFKRWLRYPIMGILTCRGCTRNCAFCGGSAFAFRRVCNRDKTVFRSPEAVARDVQQIQRISRGPIFILGDIRQPGEDYADRLLELLRRQKVKNRVMVEIFGPASEDFLRQMGEVCPGFCIEISPDSHDPEVRKAMGKNYSNEAVEETVLNAVKAGCQRVDVFFMIGLLKQTYQSVMDTVNYCESLLRRPELEKKVIPFIAPLAPFLDPGSLAFEHPERYGYHLFYHTLEEHRRALLSPSWKYMLNYETEWMSRDEIVSSTYEAGLRLNRLKAKYGVISADTAADIERRTIRASQIIKQIDDIMALGEPRAMEERLAQLKPVIDNASVSTVCEKTELELPVGLIKLNPLRALWSLITGR